MKSVSDLMVKDYKKKFCHVHEEYFTQRFLNVAGHIVTTTCPKCHADYKAKESMERKLENEEFINHESSLSDVLKTISHLDRLYDSGLTKQMIDFEPKETEAFKEFGNLIDIKTNLILYGDTGTGKTRFIAEIIKHACKHSNAYYINSIDLLNLNIKDFRFSNKFKSIRNASVLAIDECHNILKLDIDIFELIVDCVYSNNGYLIMAGNISPDMIKNMMTDRIKSRLNEKGVKIIKFFGEDMRNKNKEQ